MDKAFLDTEFNFGKVLILRTDSKLSVEEIGTKIRATKVTQFKIDKRRKQAINMVAADIARAMQRRRQSFYYLEVKLFAVEGDAVSTFISIEHDEFLAALVLNADIVKNIHNNVIVLEDLRSAYFHAIVSPKFDLAELNLLTPDDEIQSHISEVKTALETLKTISQERIVLYEAKLDTLLLSTW